MLRTHTTKTTHKGGSAANGALMVLLLLLFLLPLSCYCCVGPTDGGCVFAYCDLLSVGCFLLAIAVVVSRVFIECCFFALGDTMLTMFFSYFYSFSCSAQETRRRGLI